MVLVPGTPLVPQKRKGPSRGLKSKNRGLHLEALRTQTPPRLIVVPVMTVPAPMMIITMMPVISVV